MWVCKKGVVMPKLKGKPVSLKGPLPSLHSKAPSFSLVDQHLKDRSSEEFSGKKVLLSTVPSVDTETCSRMTKRINAFAKEHPNIICLVVSADLPFAQKRFCQMEKVENMLTLSMMRDQKFAEDYGILIAEGPLKGLLTRALFIIGPQGSMDYIQIVDEITEEPSYEEAFSKLKHL